MSKGQNVEWCVLVGNISIRRYFLSTFCTFCLSRRFFSSTLCPSRHIFYSTFCSIRRFFYLRFVRRLFFTIGLFLLRRFVGESIERHLKKPVLERVILAPTLSFSLTPQVAFYEAECRLLPSKIIVTFCAPRSNTGMNKLPAFTRFVTSSEGEKSPPLGQPSVGRSNILGKYIWCTVHSPIVSPSTIDHHPYIYFSRDLRRIYDMTISWYNTLKLFPDRIWTMGYYRILLRSLHQWWNASML